jgi:hypothetical protein
MKKNFLVVTFLCAIAFSATAQQAVKLGPLGFLLGNYNLRYEKAISEKGSFQVGANYYDYELLSLETTGFGLDAAYRNYFREAISGAYVSPVVGVQFNKTSSSTWTTENGEMVITQEDDLGFSLLNIGATLGYQWVAGGGFVTDLGLGYGYRMELSKDEGLGDYNGGRVMFTFALGYAF